MNSDQLLSRFSMNEQIIAYWYRHKCLINIFHMLNNTGTSHVLRANNWTSELVNEQRSFQFDNNSFCKKNVFGSVFIDPWPKTVLFFFSIYPLKFKSFDSISIDISQSAPFPIRNLSDAAKIFDTQNTQPIFRITAAFVCTIHNKRSALCYWNWSNTLRDHIKSHAKLTISLV